MKILFTNARILTMSNQPIFEGDLIVENHLITYVGETKKHSQTFARVIDCHKNLLMPGFKNAHTHSAMSFLRSHADDMPLQNWLFDYVFPCEANLTENDIYELSKLSYLEYLTSGVTANFDQYFHPKSIAKASVDFGMRSLVMIMKNDIYDHDILAEMYRTNDPESLTNYCFGVHAEYTVEEEELNIVNQLVHDFRAPFYTHLAETRKEVEECKERHGLTPAEFFVDKGLYDYGGGAYHCCYMTDHDLELFKKHNLSIVTCPGSNTKLASGVAEIEKIRGTGINLAIGTDGPASNNCLDMFREMFLVTGLQKLLLKDPSVTPAYEILKMATVGGAKAMRLENADILAAGKLADIIMIDLNRPNMQPIHDIAKNLVFSGSKENVKMTMINGKILYENGKFHLLNGETPDEINKTCQEISEKLIALKIRH